MNILIVDDYPENRYLLRVLLEGKKHQVSEAQNGKEALVQLAEKDIQVIVSDVLMPEMDGFELCRKCKTDKQYQQIPFIFYTATYTEQEDEEFALELGADGFIKKPIEPDKLVEQIEQILKKYA